MSSVQSQTIFILVLDLTLALVAVHQCSIQGKVSSLQEGGLSRHVLLNASCKMRFVFILNHCSFV